MMPAPDHTSMYLHTYLRYVFMTIDWKALFYLLFHFICSHSSATSLNICFRDVERLSANSTQGSVVLSLPQALKWLFQKSPMKDFPKPKLRSAVHFALHLSWTLLVLFSFPWLLSSTTLIALVKDSPYPPAGGYLGFLPTCGPATLICHFDCHPLGAASKISLSSDGLLWWAYCCLIPYRYKGLFCIQAASEHAFCNQWE